MRLYILLTFAGWVADRELGGHGARDRQAFAGQVSEQWPSRASMATAPASGSNVGPTGGKSWLFRFMLDGRAREMGLGALHTIGLAEARERANRCPTIAARRHRPTGRAQCRADPPQGWKPRAQRPSRTAAARYVAANRAGWRNAKHAAQWDSTLPSTPYPTIGALPVSAVETGHITKVLEPIWSEKPETASRVRGPHRGGAGLRQGSRAGAAGENPARWKGHLENVLPKAVKGAGRCASCRAALARDCCVHGHACRARRRRRAGTCGSPSSPPRGPAR